VAAADHFVTAAAHKPKLRGVSHAAAIVLACGAAAALLSAPVSGPRFTGAAVYAASVVALFSASALLHLPDWSGPRLALFRRIDHCVIFLTIAATYTPYAVLEGHATAGLWVLWGCALSGVALSIGWLGMPRGLRASLYVAMGLATTPLLFRLPAIIGWPRVLAHCAAAVLYISGAATWARRWPDPAPDVFGFHEVFHVLVVAGVFTQYAVLLDVHWATS
jgi:hemolysin III